VIEGLVPPGVREIQIPFGEISGHYQPPQMYPVIDVKAICFRDNALMQGNVAAHTEHINLGAISKEGSVFNAIKRVMPEIKAISLPNSGCGRFSCYISVEKKTFRDVQVAAMTAFAEMPNAKLVVVVDEEIDVFNETEVMWAVTTQTRWDKDVSVIPRVQSFRSWLGDAVVIIDATRPEDVSDFPERNQISEDVISQIRNRLGI
jgi:UbiD family decarboxylase